MDDSVGNVNPQDRSGTPRIEMPTEVTAARPADSSLAPFVVGVGASAGGLHALEEFFSNMPPDSGAAFVVVQHLSPEFKSVMKELLSRHTNMQVERAEEGMPLLPDRIYLIPPKKNLAVLEGHLRVTDQDLSPGHQLPFAINVFLESIANTYKEHAIGVILSGTGTDGTLGVRAIHEAGGLVFVQDPATAEFDGMPRSAIQSGLIHRVASPARMAIDIHELLKRPELSPATQSTALAEEYHVEGILRLLSREHGVDFTAYKHTTAARRIARRMFLSGVQTAREYSQQLEESQEERDALRNDLLINVTRFFRDRAAWQFMERDLIPKILQESSQSDQIRVWSAGCATGEEAYSFGILLAEGMDRLGIHRDVKIFATDVARHVVEKAAEGVYPLAIASDLSKERIGRYFTTKGSSLQVSRALREMVIIASHNLGKDAPFSKMDLVACRNVLIYMQPELQRRVLANLHFALRTNGVLFLGSAENLGELESEFQVVHRKHKFFQKRRSVLLPLTHPRAHYDPPRAPSKRTGEVNLPSRNFHAAPETLLQQTIEDLLGEEDSAVLIVGKENQLLYAFGCTERYLRVPQGRQTADVTKLLLEELGLAVSTGLHQARSKEQAVVYQGVRARLGDQVLSVTVSVRPHSIPTLPGECHSILIRPSASGAERADDQPYEHRNAAEQRVRDLEHELQRSRENLQATIEELETANEEQQSSNEELLASNEELQSTNEELQSVNEELHTVNAEYQQKIQELTDLNLDFDNLLSSTNIGTIFLDDQLLIRKFTPAARNAVYLVDQDIGRPISDLSTDIRHNLTADLHQVLHTGKAVEQRVTNSRGTHFLMRVHPYVSATNQVQGIVLTFVNVTEIRETELELIEVTSELELIEFGPAPESSNVSRKLWVLVVSADRGDQELVQHELAAHPVGIHVDVANNLEAAQERLQKSSYDLQIIDPLLPDGSGLGLLSGSPSIPTIVLSAAADGTAIAEALEHHALDYIIKRAEVPYAPLLAARLSRAVALIIRRIQLHERIAAIRTRLKM